ncbi:MAG TPA: D-glucuronyl C5-epimerase family protein [Ktedonosporobacter sp.]|nr:D-glucuronyl C5-epimerase family protein [Ktedonosporobacter sp.]
MSTIKKNPAVDLPVVRTLVNIGRNWREERAKPCYRLMGVALAHPELLPYPIDMFPLLDLPFGTLDASGVLYNAPRGARPAAYQPTSIAQYALAHWDAYLMNGEDQHQQAFMIQARWLLAHENRLANGIGCWPIPFANPGYDISGPWLSALTQGNVISVFTRAYQLTQENAFLEAARRAVRSFELDILDGGISAPIGNDGVFFEEVAAYPAAHILNGYLLALFGLYDYVHFTKDSAIEALIQRSVTTLHTLIDGFDASYWSYYDLVHRRPAIWFYHSLHVILLEALAEYSGCEHCARLATRWGGYLRSPWCRLRYFLHSRSIAYIQTPLATQLRRLLTPKPVDQPKPASHPKQVDPPKQVDLSKPPADLSATGQSLNPTKPAAPLSKQVCIPITAFPVPGGMRSVLAGVSQVMQNQWQMSYLAHARGKDAQGYEIETFGGIRATPWQFPNVWLYSLSGFLKLFKLLREHHRYDIILPQDGVFSGAFAALLGKWAGIRVICMDHGNMTWLSNPELRKERMIGIEGFPWPRRLLARLRYAFYWPTLRLLASIAIRYSDIFLVAGDEVEEIYRKQFAARPDRIIRYAYQVDTTRFTPPDSATRAKLRAAQGLPEESIVITMINRLAPGKGLEFAIEGIALALAALPAEIRARVRLLIAGDGPLQAQVEADIRQRELESSCVLWGSATPSDVVTLLALSDIFLYSGTRGTNYSMAVLEAMAASCAVVASVSPLSNARLLADGRGIAIPTADAPAIGEALAELCSDLPTCQRMGQLAREYVATYHSARELRRKLLRASFFVPEVEVERDAIHKV